MTAFFVSYNEQKGRKFEPLARRGRQPAYKLVKTAHQRRLARQR